MPLPPLRISAHPASWINKRKNAFPVVHTIRFQNNINICKQEIIWQLRNVHHKISNVLRWWGYSLNRERQRMSCVIGGGGDMQDMLRYVEQSIKSHDCFLFLNQQRRVATRAKPRHRESKRACGTRWDYLSLDRRCFFQISWDPEQKIRWDVPEMVEFADILIITPPDPCVGT